MSTLLSAHNIGFELQHKTLFKALTIAIASGDRIGLVGKNGVGKTTLLKTLAGKVEPTYGRVDPIGKVHYLPQLDFSLFTSSNTVSDFIAQSELSLPQVQISLERLFGLIPIVPDKSMSALSGGELAKLLIAMSDVKKPDVLLLDEPTNHLDAEGLDTLKKYLCDFKGAFVVVSHDPFFLDHVATSLWEINGGQLVRYGGTYSEYQEQKRLTEEARERDLEAAKKAVRKARKAIENREMQVVRATRAGKKAKSEPSRDKFAEGFFKGQSEKTAGKLKRQQDKMIEERQERLSQLQKPGRKTTHLSLQIGEDRSRRMLVSVSDGVLKVGDNSLLEGINLRVEFGDRMVVTGKNGSGKSSLMKALIGLPGSFIISGKIKRSDSFEAVYLDQKYQTVRPELSILDNLLKTNPNINESLARDHLGKFLFGKGISVTALASTLSGGETARLALAQVTSSTIDLLVLDEPTNNLDIETLDIIAAALEDFPGAIIVISHNVSFLSRLSIEHAYVLTGRRLREMKYLPGDEESFYVELVEAE